MKTILVTGGCGFIASHFVRRLVASAEWRVVNLDKLTYAASPERLEGVAEDQRYRFVRGDIADAALVDRVFAEERPGVVANFAAESHVDRSIMEAMPFLRTNIFGTQVLLDAAHKSGVERFLQVSTDEVYGDADGRRPFREEDPLQPSSPYSASKAAADLLCLAQRRTHGTPVLVVRSTNNYGPFQFPEKLIPLIIRNAIRGETLPVYGDGLQRRDWLHVDDNVEAILQVFSKGEVGSIYNIGSDQVSTNVSLVQEICRLLAEEGQQDLALLRSRIQMVPDRPGHDREYRLSADRLRRELAWRPLVAIEEGLRRTVRWYLGHVEWMDRVTAVGYQDYYEDVYQRAWGKEDIESARHR